MPTKRRGSFRPPELRGTLGTLLRTTTGVVRDALERGAREGRARLDDVRTSRRRQDALADLGELVLDLIRRGEIDLAELPEARDLVRLLDEFDAEDAEPDPAPRRITTRQRFDDRPAPPASPPRRSSSARPGRPPPIEADEADDDGTVSSGAVSSGPADRSTRPTAPGRPRHAGDSASTRAPTKPIKGLWRPDVDDAPDLPDAPSPPSPPSPPSRRAPLARDPSRKGGISFDDDDDDLSDYMHPDDIPKPKNRPDGDP